jgi:hypothetical protein
VQLKQIAIAEIGNARLGVNAEGIDALVLGPEFLYGLNNGTA